MSERFRPSQELDPLNGFPLVWQSEHAPRSASYSLVRVPNIIPVTLRYEKEISSIDVGFNPTVDVLAWSIAGVADTDVLQNLHMWLERQRKGAMRPQIGAKGMEEARQYGTIDPIKGRGELFYIDFVLPIEHVYHFIHRTWQPFEFEDEYNKIPRYHLGGSDRDYRVLPQKNVDKLGRKYSRMIVERVNPYK